MRLGFKTQLKTDYAVDQAILDQIYKIIILNFKKNYSIKETKFNRKFLKFKANEKERFDLYIINMQKVKEFNLMYEIKNTSSLVYFYNNKKVLIDSGTGDNNKLSGLISNPKKLYRITIRTLKNCSKGKNFYQM